MKFSVSTSDLQKYLGIAGSAIPLKSTLPILENFLFELEDNILSITATDLEITITVKLPVDGFKSGKSIIPARRLIETIRALPNTNIKFSCDPNSNKIELATDIGEYRLTGEPIENYPSLPSFKAQDEFKLNNDTLRRLIGKTEFAVSKDELRPAMTGVLFQVRSNEIRTVSTDGHRLVRVVNHEFSTTKPERDVVLPVKATSLMLKCLEDSESSIAISEIHALFKSGSTTIHSRLIEERYPNYESVIPLDNEKKLVVDKNLLLSSVRRTSLYASSTTKLVRFSMSKNELTISAEDIDFGSEAKEKISCDYSDESFEIGFNSSYIIDILNHIDSEQVVFLFNTPSRAAIIRPQTQRDGEDLLMLIMPVRLNV